MPKESLMSKIVSVFIVIRGSKKIYSSKEEALAYLEKQRIEHRKNFKIPLNYRRFFKKRKIEDTQCLIMSGSSDKHIMYLHGGGYTNQPSRLHYEFIRKIHQDTNANILIPIYPKAPNHQFMEAYDQLYKIYLKMYKNQPSSKLIFMGDSAGGALALGLSMYLKKKKQNQPEKVCLISPYLDLMLENEEIAKVEQKDKMLGVIGGREIAKSWAGTENTSNYLLSPINGDLKGIGKVFIVTGTSDILWPDAKKFKDLALKEKVDLTFNEYPKMQHVFPILPIPEAKRAIKEIVDFINK